MCVHTHTSDRVYIYVYMYACMHGLHVCKYACMHVCMHACMYACVHPCMSTCLCTKPRGVPLEDLQILQLQFDASGQKHTNSPKKPVQRVRVQVPE